MKIGVLLPSSRLYPSLLFDFIASYDCYLKDKNRGDFSYVIEVINTGGDYKLLQQKAQTFLLNSEIKIILAFIDPYAAKQIEPFVNAAGKILVTCEPGSVIPGIEIPSPNHISFSLQGAYGSYLGVKNALSNNHIKNIYVTSFYDGGYTHCYAASRTWEKQQHPILFNFVMPFAFQELDMRILKQQIEMLHPDAIILQNCAEYGKIFFEKCKEVKISPTIPVYASPFMLEEQWIKEQPFYFENVSGYVAWHSDINTNENIHFCKVISTSCDKAANIFHLLGWEAAMLIESIADIINQKKMPAIHVLNEVSKQIFTSPRGELIWQNEFRHFVAPMYEVKLNNVGNFYKPELTGTIKNDIKDWGEFASEVPQGALSRWFNTYLCPT